MYALVLAGGRSRRLGRDKALLQRGGESQLARMVATLERHVERVFVSTRPDQQDEPERQRFSQVVDRYQEMGPLAGILSAMEEYPAADWLVLACDLPNVVDATLEHLLEARSDDHPFTAFISSHDGLPEPLCALWRAGSDDIIRRFIEEGIHCPRKILIRSKTHLIEQADPSWLDNVNTPADLAASVMEANA